MIKVPYTHAWECGDVTDCFNWDTLRKHSSIFMLIYMLSRLHAYLHAKPSNFHPGHFPSDISGTTDLSETESLSFHSSESVSYCAFISGTYYSFSHGVPDDRVFSSSREIVTIVMGLKSPEIGPPATSTKSGHLYPCLFLFSQAGIKISFHPLHFSRYT
jgi:hypothetical protein